MCFDCMAILTIIVNTGKREIKACYLLCLKSPTEHARKRIMGNLLRDGDYQNHHFNCSEINNRKSKSMSNTLQ